MFSSADELEDHLKNCHTKEVKDSLRSTVLEHSIVRAQHALRECPFCGGFPIEIEKRPSHQDREEALEKLGRHVREHLANVALILAPRETGEPVDTMSDTGSEAKTGKNSERDIEGLSESNELECLNVSCDCHDTEKKSAETKIEIKKESDIKRITEIWNVILKIKEEEFPDEDISQLVCAVKYGFSYGPENLSRPSSPEGSSKQENQEDDMDHPASQEIKVRTHADYSVGWICTLALELTAASAVLDQKHPDLPRKANDQNVYELGSISGHNIVIACPPQDMLGGISAATVATHMMSTFPSITQSLFVGIGAGVPSNDVRLGDVVVGSPTRRNPGVLMWDFGKDHGEFELMGRLKDPPMALLTALITLKVQHVLEGNKIPECLKRPRERWTQLASGYLQPVSLNDMLFEADYKHIEDPEGEGEGESCRLCDKSMIVNREPREMLIHYGLIASGNKVIRDAKFRDKLNNDLGGDVFCFEMQAAGLMHDFPCLVIRGICDYAASHTNKDWRGHAVFVAAAFAKELLTTLQPRDIESEKPAEYLLSDVHFSASAVPEDRTRIIDRNPGKQDLQGLDWLTTTDYRLQQSDYQALRQPGTGSWLLETTEYRTWLATPGQILFCQGAPGTGKTILTSVAIDHLTTSVGDDSNIGLAYIYCNFERSDQQTPDQLFACILKQLAEGLPSLPDAVKSLYGVNQHEKPRPSLQKILIALQAVIVDYRRVFTVIDALDEYGVVKSSREAFLIELARFQRQYGISVLVTSRVEPNITLEIEDNFSNTVYLVLQAPDDDIARYIEANLSDLPGPFQKNRALRDFAKIVVSEAAHGLFYLARNYLGLLRYQTTEREIRHELIALKEGKSQEVTELDAAYQRTMNRIKQQPPHAATLAKQILMWLTCARRELTVTELQHALLTKSLQRAVSSSDLLGDNELLAMCAGLVTVDQSRKVVRLAHHSIRDYLELRPNELLPSTEKDITRTCLAYLSFNTFTEGNHTQWYKMEDLLTFHPFYHYAATNWGHHARESRLPRQESMDFLDNRSAVRNSIAVLMIEKSSRAHTYFADPPTPNSVTSLHLAAYFRLTNLVPELLSTAIDSDPGDSQGRTPLSYAAGLGYEEIVSLFLEAGAETDSRGLEEHANTKESSWAYTKHGGHAGRTPLSFAAEYGHVNTSKMLLNHGADPGSKCSKHHYEGWTPLLFAVHHGHEDVVSLLLESNADPEQSSMNDEGFWKTPLSHAAEKGHTAIVQMLLKRGANAEPTITSTDIDTAGYTPLWLAAFHGHEAVMNILLDTDKVQLDLQDMFGRTILSYMVEQSHETMVRLILTRGASVDLEDNSRRTPLSYAAEAGHLEVVRILLERGADQYMEDNDWETPRSRAIRNGNLEIFAMFEGLF